MSHSGDFTPFWGTQDIPHGWTTPQTWRNIHKVNTKGFNQVFTQSIRSSINEITTASTKILHGDFRAMANTHDQSRSAWGRVSPFYDQPSQPFGPLMSPSQSSGRIKEVAVLVILHKEEHKEEIAIFQRSAPRFDHAKKGNRFFRWSVISTPKYGNMMQYWVVLDAINRGRWQIAVIDTCELQDCRVLSSSINLFGWSRGEMTRILRNNSAGKNFNPQAAQAFQLGSRSRVRDAKLQRWFKWWKPQSWCIFWIWYPLKYCFYSIDSSANFGGTVLAPRGTWDSGLLNLFPIGCFLPPNYHE